jgi:hypothetical protein
LKWRRELNAVNLLLLAGIALLLVAVMQIWWGGEGRQPSRSSSDRGFQAPTAPLLRDQQPLEAFAVVAAKNLFSQDRRGPSLGPVQGQNSLENHQLLGILIIGDTRAALIGGKLTERGKGASEVEVVYQGEEYGAFKVIEISNDAVTFQGEDGLRTLNFPESEISEDK